MASPLVQIAQGLVKGVTGEALNGQKFYQFLGIPYAKATTGELRFKDPVPADSWKGTRDCSVPGEICVQKNEASGELEGSEDSLNLNVFTRNLPQEEKQQLKPVLVWIHGGGFMMGSNSPIFYGPEHLLNEDIVLVSINYRLGLFGLLRIKNADNENVGGNMALKDQLEALKWVKKNIASFNGDPNNVTLFGESAGSASVHYHVLSPKSRGYFHKAILQSGVAINNWADAESQFDDHSAVLIAKLAGYDVASETEAVAVLRRAPVETIMSAQLEYMKTSRSGILCPCIEKPSENAFLTKKPIDLVTSGDYNKVPMILGYNSKEGLLFMSPLFNIRELKLRNIVPYKADPDTVKKTKDKIEKFYFEGNSDRRDAEIDLIGDSDFIFGIVAGAEIHARTSGCPVYLYKMTLDTSLNFFKNISQLEDFPGTAHADDLGYLFKTFASPEIKTGSIEEQSIHKLVKLWTNFARYGNPTPKDDILNIVWNSATSKQLNTLVIDKELTLAVNPDEERIRVWKEVYRGHPNSEWLLAEYPRSALARKHRRRKQ